MSLTPPFDAAKAHILNSAGDFRPTLAIATGSNLAELVDAIENPISIPYHTIPGVVTTASVAGHTHSRLVLGTLYGCKVACLQGRLHRYEGLPYEGMQILFNALKWLGCDQVLMANASGSLQAEVGPGELVVVTDHINLSFGSPLQGPNQAELGPRFLSMTNVYDIKMRETLKQVAAIDGITLHDGVYAGVAGPMFETPAEIRMLKTVGADLVGMSTIPDVIFSHHCGLKVAVVATIVNLAAGMVPGAELTHEETLHQCELAGKKLMKVFVGYVKACA